MDLLNPSLSQSWAWSAISGGRDVGAWQQPRPTHKKWKSAFRTFGKDVYVTAHSECKCYTRFGGHLPVPRAEAVLPYWVPLSMRPRKQVSKMVRCCVFRAVGACSCPCHRFGGHLPMPRDRAMMPYWVPRGLRLQKVVKRQEGLKGSPGSPQGSRSWRGHWQILGDERRLLKWRQLQALHQVEPQAGGPGPLLPLNSSLLAVLHAILRVITAIRQFFWY